MPGKILNCVLALAVRIILWRTHHPCAMLLGSFMVAVDVRSTHERVVRARSSTMCSGFSAARRFAAVRRRFHHYHRPISNIELCPMVPDPNPQGESKGVAKPLHGFTHVRIHELRNHRAARY